MEKLLEVLRRDFTDLIFVEGETFSWSPATGQIFYTAKSAPAAKWSLLHEAAHALLKHNTFSLDIELLAMEIAAWEHAKKIALKYSIRIDDEYAQGCLDSYRDWLHRRSVCPTCSNKSTQQNNGKTYSCFNCHTSWEVTLSRFCRPYRQPYENKKSPVSITATGDSLR